MAKQSVDRLVGRAQIILSAIFTMGYFSILWLFFTGRISTPVEWKDQLSVLLGVLTAGEILILQFWFARARPEGKSEDV